MGSKQHVYGTASSSQLFNYPPMDDNFTTKIIVKTFLAANIPFKKIRNPTLQYLFTEVGSPLQTSRRARSWKNC